MNLMSAPMYCTCERSIACSAPITRVGSPGAPGWTMGGRASTAVPPAVRHAANETSAGSRATTRIRSMCAHRTRAADRRSGFARKEFMRFAPRAFIEWMVSSVTQARNSRANGTSFASTMFMHLRVIAGAAFLTVVCACGPTMPPTSAPKPADPTFDPFRTVLQQYIDQTQPYRKQAAQAQESTPGKATPTTAAATAVRTRQNDLGDALRTKLRPNARQGELFTPDITDAFRHRIAAALDSPKRQLRGGTLFALIGDSASGDQPQEAIAQAMLTYFSTARRFSFVLMLGVNLYHDDYENEFLVPYKALLDRGVKFYAAIGNHDRDLEIHFKPFNMSDKDRYSFDEGNAR